MSSRVFSAFSAVPTLSAFLVPHLKSGPSPR
jgi:hypothetical protein